MFHICFIPFLFPRFLYCSRVYVLYSFWNSGARQTARQTWFIAQERGIQRVVGKAWRSRSINRELQAGLVVSSLCNILFASLVIYFRKYTTRLQYSDISSACTLDILSRSNHQISLTATAPRSQQSIAGQSVLRD